MIAPLAASILLIGAPAAPTSCETVAALAPANVHALRSELVAAEDGAPSFCRVRGVIEAEIGFELRLPVAAAWNGKILVGGVGGQAGQVNAVELARGVKRGYATASTDAGHKASDVHWLLGAPGRAPNYAYRANHLLAVAVKEITRRYYVRPIDHAFFVGCSGGGRQALTEVQKFPDDFDGVIAGAPGVNTPEMSARRLWEMVEFDRYKGLMSDADWRLVANRAVAQCDRDDGVEDGVIDDPQACRFDWSRLLCKPGWGQDCLSPSQLAFAKTIYAPLRDETGRQLDEGLLPGVPVQAAPLPEPFTPGPAYLATVLFADGVHHDPNWNPRNLDLAKDLPAVDKVMDLHADDPDLSRFARRGGKLILFQGLADPLVAAQPTIAYYQAVVRRNGGLKEAQAFARLFLVPGMAHCVGGAGVDRFGQAGGRDGLAQDPEHDLLSALDAWVEQGRAPSRIVAARIEDGVVTRSRPLCAYPMHAAYVAGDPGQASSFVCRVSESRSK